jgi:hypothetical protein
MRILFSLVGVAILAVPMVAQSGRQGPDAGPATAATGPGQASPLACDRLALSPEARTRHFDELGPRLSALRMGVRELPDGYAFQFPADAKTVLLLAEWAAGERLCCPFFDIDIRMEPEGGPMWLTLTGRKGTKDVIRADAPAWVNGTSGVIQSSANAAQRIPLSRTADFFVTELEKQLTKAADAMPAWKYPFVPTAGEFTGVRTFGQQVKHLAATNYILAAAALREPVPADAGDETGPQALYMKEEILDYLKGSFRALHRAAAAIDDDNVAIPDVPISPLIGQATRLGYVQEALIHMYDHYGQMVIYLRMNGIIPPASR